MKKFLTLLALLVLAADPLLAHGKGRLKLGSQHLMVGGTVELTGTEFAKRETFTILLVGAAGRTELGTVKSDSAGKFVITVTVPAATAPGNYRIALEASDDDEVASADAMVMGESVATLDEHAGNQHAGGEMPSHEPLQLARARSPLVTGGAVTAIIAALALGGVLLRRNGHAG